MKVKPENDVKFDANGIKERLLQENKYIINLWSKMPTHLLPGQSQGKNTLQQSLPTRNDADTTIENERKPGKIFGSGTSRATSLEELYSKLDKMKGKKLQYKQRLLKKGLKNKVGKKKKKEEKKLKKMLVKVEKPNPNFKTDIVAPNPSKPTKPVFNSEGKIVFSKFDFTESMSDVHSKKDKETRDPHKLIKKLEKHKEKLQHLEEEGDMEKAADIREKQAWKTALQRAGGAKVKDDPELLKKSIKKKVQQKKQSRKKWVAREKQVQKQMNERQKKRSANIAEHQRKKKVQKAKRLVKKGRIIPGY